MFHFNVIYSRVMQDWIFRQVNGAYIITQHLDIFCCQNHSPQVSASSIVACYTLTHNYILCLGRGECNIVLLPTTLAYYMENPINWKLPSTLSIQFTFLLIEIGVSYKVKSLSSRVLKPNIKTALEISQDLFNIN